MHKMVFINLPVADLPRRAFPANQALSSALLQP